MTTSGLSPTHRALIAWIPAGTARLRVALPQLMALRAAQARAARRKAKVTGPDTTASARRQLIRRLVDAAPPITPEQAAELRRLHDLATRPR